MSIWAIGIAGIAGVVYVLGMILAARVFAFNDRPVSEAEAARRRARSEEE